MVTSCTLTKATLKLKASLQYLHTQYHIKVTSLSLHLAWIALASYYNAYDLPYVLYAITQQNPTYIHNGYCPQIPAL